MVRFHFLFLLLVAIAGPLIVIPAIRRIRKSTQLSRTGRNVGIFLLSVLLLPAVGILVLLSAFVIAVFPFTSRFVTQATTAGGEEVCVVQISDITEYSVSVFAHRPGEPW